MRYRQSSSVPFIPSLKRFMSRQSRLNRSKPVMSGSPNNQGGKEKKPVLTHFLCLPLVNETSLPQLEASLGEFHRNIPPRRRTVDDHPAKPRPPLFPDAALRPLGTLHLTLGVMSLPTPERLVAALKVLQSLDLTSLLREAGVQSRKAASQTASSGMSTNNDGPDAKGDLPLLKPVPTVSEAKPQPLLVSLEGLHALPKARSATVLYASPVDPTSRLYPFGVLLRDKFLEAGLIEGETKKISTPNQDERATEASNDYLRSGPEEMTIQLQNHPGAIDGGAAENVGRNGSHQRAKQRQMPKPRPLLLHATVVNTVYVRSSRGGGNRRKKSNKGRRSGALTFDARDIIAHYKDYYTDEVRTKAKPYPVDGDTPLTLQDQISGDSESSNNLSSEEEAHPSSRIKQHQRPRQEVGNESDEFPFIWASNLSIDKVCICEMGAQNLDADNNPLAMRLGQEYRVVAERSLMDPSPDADGNGDEDMVLPSTT